MYSRGIEDMNSSRPCIEHSKPQNKTLFYVISHSKEIEKMQAYTTKISYLPDQGESFICFRPYYLTLGN